MAGKPNIYVLLKNVEAFVKRVPIDPKARTYKQWLKNRNEAKKALTKAYRMLRLVEIIDAREIRPPCGTIPVKTLLLRVTPCGRIPTKTAFESYLSICRNIPTKDGTR